MNRFSFPFLLLFLVVGNYMSAQTLNKKIQHAIGINAITPLAALVNQGNIDSFGRITPALQYTVRKGAIEIVIGAGGTFQSFTRSANVGSGSTQYNAQNFCGAAALYYHRQLPNDWFAALGINYTQYAAKSSVVYSSGVDEIVHYRTQDGNGIGPSIRFGKMLSNKFSLVCEYALLQKNMRQLTYQYYSATPLAKFEPESTTTQLFEARYPMSVYLNYYFNRAKK
ncbi:MAG: hypothetical protein RL660_3181 [Bacteroidota bacterium]|jgi:hypothetical protein